MIVTETKSQHSKEVTKLGGTVYDKSGYRMDVNLWFRHKNEALFYIDSVGRVHGPMDQTHSTRLGPIEKTGKEITYRREFSEQMKKDQWLKSMEFQTAKPTELHHETKHFETILRDVTTNDINNHKRSHITLANHYIPNYRNIETTNNYSTTITKQHRKPDQGVTVNIVAPTEKIMEKDNTSTIRERRLIDELLEAREELNTLRRTRSVADNYFFDGDSKNYSSEHFTSKVVTDVHPTMNNTEKIKRRHHSTQQDLQKNPDWDYRDHSISRGQTPQFQRHKNISDMTSYNTYAREKDSGPLSNYSAHKEKNMTSYDTYTREKDSGPLSNYSAHKENMKTQQLMDERHGSMRTLPTERRVNEMTEEIETITLQPIGKGIQDLAPAVSTISRPGSRAATPRVFDNTGGTTKSSFYREEHKQTGGGYNTMPAMPKFNKFSSSSYSQKLSPNEKHNNLFSRSRLGSGNFRNARNVNQVSSYDIPDSYKRNLSTGRSGHEQMVNTSWETRTESYGDGNRNFQTMLSPVSHNENMTSTNIVLSGMEEGRIPLQTVLNTEDFWYQPRLNREEVISSLRDRETGSFIIRNSSTFVGAYGLAVKVAALPEHAVRTNDAQGDLIRHFLIETVEDSSGSGVRLKGFTNEPIYPSLAHLVQDHCQNARALPIKLVISTFTSTRLDREDSGMAQSQYQYETHQRQQFGTTRMQPLTTTQRSMSSPGVNFIHPNPLHRHLVTNGLYLGKFDVDRLTGKAAIEQAVTKAMSKKNLKTTTAEIRLDSTNGITLTDKIQALFYTRQFPAQHVLCAEFDPKLREFASPILQNNGINRGRIMGIVVRKQKMILRENTVHLFCEIDKINDLNDVIIFINENYLRRA